MKVQTENNQSIATKFYRFKIVTKKKEQVNSVGMAYLREGHNIYTLRLWMFSKERFYMIPDRNDSSKFHVFTREENKSQRSENKFIWNIVGHANVVSNSCEVEIILDLLECSLFMSVFPEANANGANLPMVETFMNAA